MLWLNTKINNLVTTVNPKDIAFLLASSLEINKQKGSIEKAQAALDCLISHKSFVEYIFEFFFREKTGQLKCVAIAGINGIFRKNYVGKILEKQSIVYNIFSTRRICFDTEIIKEAGIRRDFLNKNNILSSLLLPINEFGVLIIDRFDNKKFTDYEITLLKSFVDDVVTPSLDLALDNEKNFDAAIRDSLTGLYNHGYFMFQLERELENTRRNKSNLSLIMIDIDYFKHYNDKNGHPKGDKLLKELAIILKDHTRKGDIAARYGGEEFSIILINTKLKDASQKAEELRKAVSSFKFENEESQPNNDLTISLGVANFPEHTSNFKELIKNADEALYQSKTSGKNKVTIYTKK